MNQEITNTINTANSNNTARAVDYYTCPQEGLLDNPLIKTVEEILANERKRCDSIIEILNSFDGANLARKKAPNARDYFYEVSNGGMKSLIKDNKRLAALLRNEIAIVMLRDCQDNCVALEKLLQQLLHPDKRILNKKGKLYSKSIMVANKIGMPLNLLPAFNWSGKQISWMYETYQLNSFKPEHLRFKLGNGMIVRSKSEQYIGERLAQRGVMFRYDSAFEIGDKNISPDFIILTPDGRIVIWEHFGLTTKNDYLLKSMNKIEEYRKVGFLQHKNLICTREEDILSIESIDEIIDRFGLV